ncbi:MAG: M28 family metallopeptidase [Anaerolineaceae bacterium]|nr:M28 family metallopeptidase [Anaerolineaceae bacterium]
MKAIFSHVEALAGDIGPRGTGTRGEAQAADYVADILASLGLPIEWQEFQAVGSQNAFPLAIDFMALLGVIIYPLGGVVTRWVAAGLTLAAPLLLWQTIRTSSSLLRPLLPKVGSRSVITHIEPHNERQQHTVILAHLDTNRCRLAWQAATVRYLEPLAYLTLGVLASLGLIYLCGALLEDPGWLWQASLLSAGYVLGTIITLWRDDRTPYSPGAHDNAASVAVALELAARLTANPLTKTEVWFAFTGAEETDHAGLYSLLNTYQTPLQDACFIGLEGVGSGDIVYLTKQGLCAHYYPEPVLLALAERAAARRADLGVRAAQMTMEDEVGTLRRRGYRAICIAGRDPATRTLPHWHRPDDTPDTVSPEVLDTAVEYLMAFLGEIDDQTEAVCAHL